MDEHPRGNGWSALILLIPLYALVLYMGYIAFFYEPPSVMGEPSYQLEEPHTTADIPRVR